MLRRLGLALVSAAAPLQAQTADRDLPNGRELVAVYIGASTCGPCLQQSVKDAVVQMKSLLETAAKKAGYAFAVIGVSTDWSTQTGFAFLNDNGPFDQILVGGNWTNLGVEHFIWRDSTATPAMPQIVVFERDVTLGDRIRISPPRIVRRVFGNDSIPQWVKAGAPISLGAAGTSQTR